jgi:hypothetical protein
MKNQYALGMLIIGVLVLALVAAPATAISKSDLLSYYKSHPAPGPNKIIGTEVGSRPVVIPTGASPTPGTPSPVSGQMSPTWVVPTPVPSTAGSNNPSWFLSPSWMIPWKSDSSYMQPAVTPTTTPSSPTGCAYASCPPAVPVGYLQQTLCRCMAYRNVETGEVVGEECINPETGFSYPVGMDALGNSYIVKPGCQAKWAD